MTATTMPKSLPCRQILPEALEQALDRIDAAGLSAPLELLERELEALPPALRQHTMAQWLEGYYLGRCLHERFGGVGRTA